MPAISLSQIMDMEEIDRWEEGDKIVIRTKTSTPIQGLAKLKIRLKYLIQAPIRIPRVKNIEVSERGLLWRTFIIDIYFPKYLENATLREAIKEIREERERLILPILKPQEDLE